MKLFIIKFFTILIALIGAFSALVLPADAASPIISGNVLVEGTRTPLPELWVRWTDANGSIWYKQTDTAGQYLYPSWNKLERTKETDPVRVMYNTWIDTDLDGTNDSRMVSIIYNGFGCGQVPHNFAVVLPKGWFGYFDTITPLKFANTEDSVSNPTIYYHPPKIVANPQSVKVGDSLIAHWTELGQPQGSDWIGLYHEGNPDTSFIAKKYLNCQTSPGSNPTQKEGDCTFIAPLTAPSGFYEFRLFSKDSYELITVSNKVLIINNLSTSTPTPTGTAAPTEILTPPAVGTPTPTFLPTPTLTPRPWMKIEGGDVHSNL